MRIQNSLAEADSDDFLSSDSEEEEQLDPVPESVMREEAGEPLDETYGLTPAMVSQLKRSQQMPQQHDDKVYYVSAGSSSDELSSASFFSSASASSGSSAEYSQPPTRA